MVKAYLRYEQAGTFGVVVSPNSNVIYDHSGSKVIAAALENVVLWNLKRGTADKQLSSSTEDVPGSEVTRLARSPTAPLFSSGHADGTIRIWSTASGGCEVTLSGHKSAVTALAYNRSGGQLASGGKDTDIVLWDVLGETGLYRLRGHRDQVTDVVFLERGNLLISSSKDSVVRVWDLTTQHCCQILVGNRGEVWSLAVDPAEGRLVTGSAEQELRVYTINAEASEKNEKLTDALIPSESGGVAAEQPTSTVEILSLLGTIKRQTHERVATLAYSENGEFLGCQGVGKSIELYRVRTGDAVLKRLKRRKKRLREKAKKKGPTGAPQEEEEEEDEEGNEVDVDVVTAADELELLQIVRLKNKVRSFTFSPARVKGVDCTLAVALGNNTVEAYQIVGEESECTSTVALPGHRFHPPPPHVIGLPMSQECASTVALPGHRNDVRFLMLSSDDTLLMSCSHTAVKVWNPSSGACLRTMESGYGLCGLFVPGNRHLVVGTKEGKLELFDLGSSTRTLVEDAHEGAVWSLTPLSDGSGFISGSADKDVKFWEYELVDSEEEEEGGKRQLRLRHTRTLKLAEDVLCVRLGPKGKLLAASLLDSTIKVFFADSLKFFLSLYGHKLPVLCMDISSDGTLLASGSADKNIKLWGLDFGDCHKSLFAHNDSVMQVQFVRKTHYLFSVGKDKVVKYWDCDKFETLLVLNGHHAEVWSLAVSAMGDMVCTGSHDRSIRRWERTDEPFFLEEEKEKRMDSMFEEGAEGTAGTAEEREAQVGEEGAVAAAGHRSMESVTSADSILEAMELAEEEDRQEKEHQEELTINPNLGPRKPSPLLLGMHASDYVLKAISGVRASDLEQVILVRCRAAPSPCPSHIGGPRKPLTPCRTRNGHIGEALRHAPHPCPSHIGETPRHAPHPLPKPYW
ncbi:Dip2/Utp12 protein [Cymbomonas tetramitiformis]|uniref:Dip2/Utp12 protein n=1 Tax=Cymbomonas tetramitiformis TaxID=36881 RepID=A0AAE0FZ44_9CHLO|nr:Dip2/Utp12 protein [Cymbomonas tetramitiformis]